MKSIIKTNYNFISKLGDGSFGQVYLVTDKDNNKYACKVETKGLRKSSRLVSEHNLYKRFAYLHLKCVPTIYKYFETTENNYLVMELMGKSLSDILTDSNKFVDIGTVMKIGINIFSIIETIHKAGIIHRDIKPNNFMFGCDDNISKIYIIDFGLSKKWLNGGTSHISYKSGLSLVGTARYASNNVHLGIEQSRRDDMEAIGYMLVYLAKGSLPWQGLKKKNKYSSIDEIGLKKQSVSVSSLCEDLPKCFYDYIKYTRKLEFTEKPDYDYVRKLFIDCANELNIKLKYYWEKDKEELIIDNNIDIDENVNIEDIIDETDKKSNEVCNAIFDRKLKEPKTKSTTNDSRRKTPKNKIFNKINK